MPQLVPPAAPPRGRTPVKASRASLAGRDGKRGVVAGAAALANAKLNGDGLVKVSNELKPPPAIPLADITARY